MCGLTFLPLFLRQVALVINLIFPFAFVDVYFRNGLFDGISVYVIAHISQYCRHLHEAGMVVHVDNESSL